MSVPKLLLIRNDLRLHLSVKTVKCVETMQKKLYARPIFGTFTLLENSICGELMTCFDVKKKKEKFLAEIVVV